MVKKHKKNPRKKESFPLARTDSEAGRAWLASLDEAEFRDRVLNDLFADLRQSNIVAQFENIHGRNDKGIDYLVLERGKLRDRYVGIQVKSREITRTGGNGAESAIQIKRECEAAIEHEFLFKQNRVRLDNVEIWNSGHTTQDAIDEFGSAGSRFKIPVKRSGEVFELIEEYSPRLLNDIPQYSLFNYVRRLSESPPKPFSLLGCRLNPKQHFIEPLFAAGTSSRSLSRLKRDKKKLKKQDEIDLKTIINLGGHALICGPEMSGKTYSLDHIASTVADNNDRVIPVIIDAADCEEISPSSFNAFLGKKTCGFTGSQIDALANENQFLLLVDNFEKLPRALASHLLDRDESRFRVIGSARNPDPSDSQQATCYSIVGTNLGSVRRFLREIDKTLGNDKAFLDRAMNYIERVLHSSGLPANPFVIATCLQECKASKSELSTPTFGRLISRFIDLQTGSHIDTLAADYEAKTGLLQRLSRKAGGRFAHDEFVKEIESFITQTGSPHSLEDFESDLFSSGIFEEDAERIVRWSHHVFHQYYWAKDKVEAGDHEAVLDELRKEIRIPLAAVYASLCRHCDYAIQELLKDLDAIPPPEALRFEDLVDIDDIHLLPSDQEESALLLDIETSADKDESSTENPSGSDISEEDRRKIRSNIEVIVKRIQEEKHHVAFNLSALLVNGRESDIKLKISGCRGILRSNARLGRIVERLLSTAIGSGRHPPARLGWLIFYFEMEATDRMIGDPYLKPAYEELLKQDLTLDEELILLDILLIGNEEAEEEVIGRLSSKRNLHATIAMYMRLVALYFFRFHNQREQKRIRDLLKRVRTIHKGVGLPEV